MAREGTEAPGFGMRGCSAVDSGRDNNFLPDGLFSSFLLESADTSRTLITKIGLFGKISVSTGCVFIITFIF